MIHLSVVLKLMMEYENKPIEFDISYVTLSSGRIVKGRVVCTSSNFDRRTMNIKFINSQQIRTLRTILITRFNDIPIYV
jgi:hypothetical protein